MTNAATLFHFSLRTRLRAASTWVLAAVLFSLAVLSVITARYSNELLSNLADPAIAAALQSQLHPPTSADVWDQWLKNLTQLASIVIVLVAAATLQPTGGPVVMIVTRNVSRRAYLSAQVAAFVVTSLAVTIAATAMVWLGAMVVFGSLNPLPLCGATLIWWLQASFFVLVAVLVAAALGGVGPSAGAGIGVFLLASLLTWWPPALRYSPAGLGELAGAVARGEGTDRLSWWALCVTIALSVGLWRLANITFARREL